MGRIDPRIFFLAIVSTLIMGTVPVWIKSVSANAATIGLVRLIITVVIISLILQYKKAFGSIKSRHDWAMLIVIGLVFGAHWLSYFLSIKLSSASLGAISVSTFGIHLLFLNWIVKGQKVSWLDALTVALCFGGCLLVVPKFDFSSDATIGVMLGVLSGFLYACLPLLHQRIQYIPTLTRTWGQATFAFIVFLPLYGVSEWQLPASDWVKLGILGVFCTVVAHSLWVKASTELPGIITSLVYYLYLPISIALSIVFLGEKLTLPMGIGAALILLANVGQSVVSWKKHFSS